MGVIHQSPVMAVTAGEGDGPSAADIIAGILPSLAGTPALTYATVVSSGTASTFLRTDDTVLFPTAIMSALTLSTLTLTDDAVDQILTGSLGSLDLRPASTILSLPMFTGVGDAGSNTALLRFSARTSSAASFPVTNTVRFGFDASLTIDDVGTTYTSQTHSLFRGSLTTTANSSSASIFTSETNRLLDVALSAVIASAGTHSWTERTGLLITMNTPGSTGTGNVTVTNQYGLRITHALPVTTGTTAYTNAYGVQVDMPRTGNTIKRGFHLVTATTGGGTAPANSEGFYCEDIAIGTAQRANFYAEGATTGTPTDVYGFFQGTAHVVGTNRYGARFTGATTGTPTLCVGVQVDAHAVGTTKYSFDGADPSHFNGIVMYDPSNIVLGTATGTMLGSTATEKLGFWGTVPAVQSTGWTTSNVTSDKVLDANSYTTDELADVLCTVVDTLKTYGILAA